MKSERAYERQMLELNVPGEYLRKGYDIQTTPTIEEMNMLYNDLLSRWRNGLRTIKSIGATIDVSESNLTAMFRDFVETYEYEKIIPNDYLKHAENEWSASLLCLAPCERSDIDYSHAEVCYHMEEKGFMLGFRRAVAIISELKSDSENEGSGVA